MSDENQAGSQPAQPSARPPLPSQVTTKKMLLAMAAIYGVWLAWMAYVAWVNVRAGNP